jgi:hypothetical protein
MYLSSHRLGDHSGQLLTLLPTSGPVPLGCGLCRLPVRAAGARSGRRRAGALLPVDRPGRLGRFCDAYGLADRAGLVDTIVRRVQAVCDLIVGRRPRATRSSSSTWRKGTWTATGVTWCSSSHCGSPSRRRWLPGNTARQSSDAISHRAAVSISRDRPVKHHPSQHTCW